MRDLDQKLLWQKEKVRQAEDTLRRLRIYCSDNVKAAEAARRHIKDISAQMKELRTVADVVLLSEYSRLDQELEGWKTSLETLRAQSFGFKDSEAGAVIDLKIEQSALLNMQKEIDSRSRVLEFPNDR